MAAQAQQQIIRPRASAARQTTADQRAIARTPVPFDEDDDLYDDQWPPRLPTSARRYNRPPPVAPPPRRRGLGGSGLSAVVLSCVFMGVCLATIIPPVWQNWRDSATYGYPRTYQMNADVGHGDPNHRTSHFIALNNNGNLEVIELAGGDPATYPPRLYKIATLTGAGADLVVLTMSVSDVNGDGRLDLIASYSGTEVILFNDGKTFVSKL